MVPVVAMEKIHKMIMSRSLVLLLILLIFYTCNVGINEEDCKMAIDPAFGVNNFLQPKYYNESETVANNFMTLLFGKPGFFPSIPELGIDVQSLLYQYFDDIDIGSLKNEIINQCSAYMNYVIEEEFQIVKRFYKDQPLLIFILPIQEKSTTRHFSVGITTSFDEGIRYNFTWTD